MPGKKILMFFGAFDPLRCVFRDPDSYIYYGYDDYYDDRLERIH